MTKLDLPQSLELRRERLHEQIADSLQEMIAQQKLEPGARLPALRYLAKQLDVSRTTVGEAVRLLEHRGLVVMKVTSGTYVTDVAHSVLADSMERLFSLGTATHQDLMIFREMLEPAVAALAAARATPEDLANTKELLELNEQAWYSPDPDEHMDAEVSYHQALAQATHNELVIAIYAGIQKVFRSVMCDFARLPGLQDDEIGMQSHQSIFDAVAAHDPVRAREAMVEHLRLTRQKMGRALQDG